MTPSHSSSAHAASSGSHAPYSGGARPSGFSGGSGFSRGHRSGSGDRSGDRPADRSGERVVALVDARFLAWLAGSNASAAEGTALSRRRLMGVLSQALRDAGLPAHLHRIYWYTDRNDGQMIDGQVVRPVASVDADGGLAMMRAIGHDLSRIAEYRGAEHLVIASDDDRLIAWVDTAQQRGALVHLLVDERARDPRQLREDDSGWASLLAQADRRIVMTAAQCADLLGPDRGNSHAGGAHAASAAGGAPRGPFSEAEVDRSLIATVVQGWWGEQDMPARDVLHEALPKVRGLPQDADRELLMRLGQQLGRPLSVPEKKVMRETARTTIEANGDSADGSASEAVSAVASGASLDEQTREDEITS